MKKEDLEQLKQALLAQADIERQNKKMASEALLAQADMERQEKGRYR